jgi:hypothetical protein
VREPRRSPYTWTTWLTALLAGEASCWFAPWVKSHFKIDKLERSDFDLVAWKAQHTDMVDARVTQLRADGWTVTVEDQNFFTLRGRTGTLSGKPDILAIRDLDALVIDCKGGKHRTADVQQVLLYMFALPLGTRLQEGMRLSGEVQYRDGSVHVRPDDFTPELRKRITDAMLRVSAEAQPLAVPSVRECAFCDVGASDCQARMESTTTEVTVSEW